MENNLGKLVLYLIAFLILLGCGIYVSITFFNETLGFAVCGTGFSLFILAFWHLIKSEE